MQLKLEKGVCERHSPAAPKSQEEVPGGWGAQILLQDPILGQCGCKGGCDSMGILCWSRVLAGAVEREEPVLQQVWWEWCDLEGDPHWSSSQRTDLMGKRSTLEQLLKDWPRGKRINTGAVPEGLAPWN